MRPLRFALSAVAALGVCASAYAQSSETGSNRIDRGKALAISNCSGCHAVGPEGDSPNPKAPPFRTLSERFPIDALEETFIGTIDTGHPGMPVFVATQEQIEDIIAYIASVMQ